MRVEFGSDFIVGITLNQASRSDEIELGNGKLHPPYLQPDQIEALRKAQLDEQSVQIVLEIDES